MFTRFVWLAAFGFTFMIISGLIPGSTITLDQPYITVKQVVLVFGWMLVIMSVVVLIAAVRQR